MALITIVIGSWPRLFPVSLSIGVLSDRVIRLTLAAIGLVLLLVADLVLAFASDIVSVGNRRSALGPAHGFHPRLMQP